VTADSRAVFEILLSVVLLALGSVASELRISRGTVDFDPQKSSGAIFRKEGIDRFQEQSFYTGRGLRNPGFQPQRTVEIERPIESVVSRQVHVGAGHSERQSLERHDLVFEVERASHFRNDFIDLLVLRLSLTAAAQRIDLVLNS
jgi:hypothetical protein